MKKLTIGDCAAFFRVQDNFCILTHRRPDGDTLGSAATLCRGLRQLGKTAFVLYNPEITEKYAPILAGLTTDTVAENATIVCVDTASAGMLPLAFADLADKIQLRIDHHASATSFTEMELVDGDSAACGELIYEILMELGVKEKVVIHKPEFAVCLSKDTYTVVPSYQLPKGYIKGTTGAGDAFCAGTLIGIYEGWSDSEILEFGSACAVMALGKADATSGLVTKAEIKDYCKQFDKRSEPSKI